MADKCIIELNDLNKEEMSKDDYERCKLAAVYQMIDQKGWSEIIFNHVTVRSPSNPLNFFINPYGLLFSEITASTIVKCDSQGNVLDGGSTDLGIIKTGFLLHSAIHGARKDINAVIHIHTGLAAGLSTLKYGLLPISQHAMFVGKVAYHDYAGVLMDDSMRKRIYDDLANNDSKILILRNHGIAAMGKTLEEAWFYLFQFMIAADIQFHALSQAHGLENVIIPPEEIQDQVQQYVNSASLKNDNKPEDGAIQWGTGEMEFEALMRRLDLMGYNTGYPYKRKIVKKVK